MQGVLFRPGDQRFEGKRAEDAVKAALADPSCLMVNRNAGAGTRVLIDKLARAARGRPATPTSRARTTPSPPRSRRRAPTGASPSSRWREMYGLGFLPLAPEHYDFLLVESRRERPAVQAFLAALRDRRTKDRIAALGMQPADD